MIRSWIYIVLKILYHSINNCTYSINSLPFYLIDILVTKVNICHPAWCLLLSFHCLSVLIQSLACDSCKWLLVLHAPIAWCVAIFFGMMFRLKDCEVYGKTISFHHLGSLVISLTFFLVQFSFHKSIFSNFAQIMF